MNNLGQKIKKIRKINNWKQADLSSKMSQMLGKAVPRSAISHWENGNRVPVKIHLDCLFELFQIYRVDVTDSNILSVSDIPFNVISHRLPIVNLGKISEAPWKKSLESGELYIGSNFLGPGNYAILEIDEEIKINGMISLRKKALLKLQDKVNKGDISAIIIKKIRKALITRAHESGDGLVFIEELGKDSRIFKSKEIIIFGKVLYFINKA